MRARFTVGRFFAVWYGALAVLAVVCLLFDLSPAIPAWLVVVATCAPIALVLFVETL
jgi:hypothetical protein